MPIAKQDWWFKEYHNGALCTRLGEGVACICRDGRTWTQQELVELARTGPDAWNKWHDSLERIVWYRLKGGSKLHNAFVGRIAARAYRTDFSRSKFDRSILSVTFDDAVLLATDFADSDWLDVKFIDTDLSVADGLLQAKVHRPPVLDHRTLWRSGPLPYEFYRMCGFPESFVDYLPSMVQQAINLQSCFISYSAQDEAFVRRLYADLQKYKVSAFFAPKDLKIGSRIRDELETAIHTQDKLLLVLSRKSIHSQWVEYEVEAAIARESREKRDVLFPIAIDNEVFTTSKAWAATLRRQRHIGDFRNTHYQGSYQSALRKLLSDLSVELD